MSNRCPWRDYKLHRYSDKADCYVQHMYDDTYTHIFKDILYSVDPETGQPLARVLIHSDDILMKEFGLNHRVCNVETKLNTNDLHVLDFRPESATQLWALVRNVYNKWEQLYENNGRQYWPCRSQAVDLILDGSTDSLKCMQPTRFITKKHKLAQSLMDLLMVLTTNYYHRISELYENDFNFAESTDSSKHKVRRIECNAADKAVHFFKLFDQERYERVTKGSEENQYCCYVKQIQDAVSRSEAHRYTPNFQKKLFHQTIADVFTTHKEHAHMLLCTRYHVEDNDHCDSWLQLLLAFADNKLQVEGAQTRLIATVKQWKQQYSRHDRKTKGKSSGGGTRAEDGTDTPNVFSSLGLWRGGSSSAEMGPLE